jgi:hypothetical protein
MTVQIDNYSTVDFTWPGGKATVIIAPMDGMTSDEAADLFIDGLTGSTDIKYTLVSTKVDERTIRAKRPRPPRAPK